jgi:hypothetical protein
MALPATDITQTGVAAWGTSAIRTYFPIGVGAFLTWLAAYGFGVDPETQAGLIYGLSGLGGALWYGLLRAVEPKLPAAVRALLFLSTKLPTYAPAPVVAAPPRELVDPDSGERVLAYLVTDMR